MSYLTDSELSAVQHLHKRAPYAIQGVSGGMFSLARLYGSARYQGEAYRYVAEHDELVRLDVMRVVEGLRRKQQAHERREAERAAKTAQGALL